MKKFTLFLPALAAAFLLFGPSTAATADDTPVTLAISPAISDIKISRGQSLTRQITVINQQTTPMAVRTYAENFEASDPFGGLSFNTDDTTQYSSSSWLKLADPNLVIDPGGQASLTYTIDCPPDAEPGGHYSAIFFEPVSAASEGPNSHIGVSQRVGALLFITVAGGNIEQGKVLGANTTGGCSGLSCSFKTNLFREWGPVPFTFSFQNTGNVHVKVSGKIEIFNILNQKMAEIPVEDKTVLPSSSRTFQETWLREALFGIYHAKLTLIYGAQASTQSANLTFWVLPWHALLVAAIVVLFVGVGIFLRQRKKHRIESAP